MSDQQVQLPLFPLGSVLFPGQSLPLRVFEDRYRAMVRDLQQSPDPTTRLFASVAIREGYEVGTLASRSLYRVGCSVQVTDITPASGGGYHLTGVVRGRLRIDAIHEGEEYSQADVTLMRERPVAVDDLLMDRVLLQFRTLRRELAQWREFPPPAALPRDAEFLSWTLAALTPLPMAERQSLLEASDARFRMELLSRLLKEELRAMTAIPSMPANDLTRNRWSPN